MESKNVFYRNGHFYDERTQQRITLQDGARVCIVSYSGVFKEAEPAGNHTKPLSKKDLEDKIKNDDSISNYRCLLKRGILLYVEMSVNSEKYIFEVELLEELYAHLKSHWKLQEGRLYDCSCIIRKELGNKIDFFEPVYGKSLNEVYKNTYVHFFGNDGNPAANAIDRFHTHASCHKNDAIRHLLPNWEKEKPVDQYNEMERLVL